MPSPFPSGLTPQQKAARVSAENRRAAAAERKRKSEWPARLAAGHKRGEHEGDIHIGCPLCPTLAEVDAAEAAWEKAWGEGGSGEMYRSEIVEMLKAAAVVRYDSEGGAS